MKVNNIFKKSEDAQKRDKAKSTKKSTKKSAETSEALKDDSIVSMLEKVRFWEEQDQINKALIPRVLQNHSLLVKLNVQNQETLNLIAKIREENMLFKKKIKELESINIELMNTESTNIKPKYIADSKVNSLSLVLSSVACLAVIIGFFI